MRATALIVAMLAPLAGCMPSTAAQIGAIPPVASSEGPRHLPVAALGERITVDGPQLTALEVIEDSRCPRAVTCIWAGRVRLLVRIHTGPGDVTRELVLGDPVQVADGSLELAQVLPARRAGEDIALADYRFAFRFDGGL